MLAAFRKTTTLPTSRPEGSGTGGGRGPCGPGRAVWAESLVLTQHGMRPLRAVIPGDRVLTFDDHDAEVRAVSRGFHDGFGGVTLLKVAAGAVGNRDALILTGDQRVLLESDEAERLTGAPFALVPALQLERRAGVTRMVSDVPIETVALHFEEEQAVSAAGGLLMHCVAARDASAIGCLLRQRVAAPRHAEVPALA